MRISWMVLLMLPASSALAAPPYSKLVDDYFDFFFKHNPSAATAEGFHEYDGILEDFSRNEVSAQVELYQRYLEQFEAIRSETRSTPKLLSADDRLDLDLLISSIRSALLELKDIRQWEKDPDRYSSGITQSAYSIISRDFAPAEARLQSLTSREQKMPDVFVAARENLKNPPRIYTQIAIEQIDGNIDFFKKDVPEAFKDVHDAKLLAAFKSSNERVIRELEGYKKFLKALLPRSKGDFRLGKENYRKKLLYDEMVDIPLDRLLKAGYRNLRENQRMFKEVAAKLNPKLTPKQILDELAKDHPSAKDLLSTFRSTLDGLRDFLVEHHIVTVPSRVKPIVEETPPFLRALTFASMDTPGPYETKAKEAYFNVTLPEAGWPKKQTEEYLEGFNRGTIISTAAHETYPGHYVQFLWLQKVPSKVRKLIGCSSNAEGWAHYSEQMMLDEGYGGGDLRLRLGQLQDALLRDARYIVGIEMHTGKMTLEQATDFFVKEGYQTRAVGEKEASRGTSDPTYLVYTLGKLEILKLREDYKKAVGDRFSLQAFHDAFLRQGYPPIRIVRKALLGSEGALL